MRKQLAARSATLSLADFEQISRRFAYPLCTLSLADFEPSRDSSHELYCASLSLADFELIGSTGCGKTTFIPLSLADFEPIADAAQ